MRFDSPVGTAIERDAVQIWPGAWIDATGFCTYYNATGAWAYHTGADLNLNRPAFDADAHAPVHSIADGLVVAAELLPAWGHVICIRHDAPGGTVWSRYAHVENVTVKSGLAVIGGQQIAQIGNAEGRYPYHLHFDIAMIDLGAAPGDWPGVDKARLLKTYHDPKQYILDNHLDGGDPTGSKVHKYEVTAIPYVRVRIAPEGAIVGCLLTGAVVVGEAAVNGWVKLYIDGAGGAPVKQTADLATPAPLYVNALYLKELSGG